MQLPTRIHAKQCKTSWIPIQATKKNICPCSLVSRVVSAPVSLRLLRFLVFFPECAKGFFLSSFFSFMFLGGWVIVPLGLWFFC